MASCLRRTGQSCSLTSLLLSTSEWALSLSDPWVEDLDLSLCGVAEWHKYTSGPLCLSLSLCLLHSFCMSSGSWALIYDLFFLKSLSAQRKEGGGDRKDSVGDRERKTTRQKERLKVKKDRKGTLKTISETEKKRQEGRRGREKGQRRWWEWDRKWGRKKERQKDTKNKKRKKKERISGQAQACRLYFSPFSLSLSLEQPQAVQTWLWGCGGAVADQTYDLIRSGHCGFSGQGIFLCEWLH